MLFKASVCLPYKLNVVELTSSEQKRKQKLKIITAI